MKAEKKNLVFVILLAMLFGSMSFLTGCTMPRGPIEVSLPPVPTRTQQSITAEKRFQEPAPNNPTAVESAIELSKKYAKLSEEATLLRQKHQESFAENRRLRDRLTSLEAQLQQAEKELTEANELLIDMRVELNNWKANVLGFRDEMRDAEKAQLETLLKILKVLGGESKEYTAQDKDVSSTKSSQSEPAKVVALETPISGETDE